MLTNIFQDFFVWDTFMHTASGFIFAFLGYKLIIKLKNKKVINKSIVIIFCICFSMTIGIFWEFFEFSSDVFNLTDMQKDRILENISSIKINEFSNNKPIIIKEIDHTILYDKSNNVLLEMNGYLDVGIVDTMKDLFVNLIGSCIFLLFFNKILIDGKKTIVL